MGGVTLTPEQQAVLQQYRGTLDEGARDYTQTNVPNQSRHAGAATWGPNLSGSTDYVAWAKAGPSTFVGIRPDGSKQFMSAQQAMSLGYQPPQQVGPEEFYERDFDGDGQIDPTDQLQPAPPPVPPAGGGNGGPGPGGGGPAPGPGAGGGGGPQTPTQPEPTTPWTPDLSAADTSWEWDTFRPDRGADGEWGGYDPDYAAFERYVPGMESPWGVPDVEGGNQDFYQQQFLNLLRDEQGFRSRQRAAQLRAQQARENPLEAPEMNWDWTDLPEVRTVEGASYDESGNPQSMTTWNLDERFTPRQTTNVELFNTLAPGLDQDAQNVLGRYFGTQNPQGWADPSSTWFATAGSPTRLQQGIAADTDPRLRDALNQLWGMAYQQSDVATPQGGGPSAPPGYALPM